MKCMNQYMGWALDSFAFSQPHPTPFHPTAPPTTRHPRTHHSLHPAWTQFIAGFANMRARNYSIPEVDKLQVGLMFFVVFLSFFCYFLLPVCGCLHNYSIPEVGKLQVCCLVCFMFIEMFLQYHRVWSGLLKNKKIN